MEDCKCEDGNYKNEKKKGRRHKSEQKLQLRENFGP
jgi:hypothetical protein